MSKQIFQTNQTPIYFQSILAQLAQILADCTNQTFEYHLDSLCKVFKKPLDLYFQEVWFRAETKLLQNRDYAKDSD